LGVVMVIFSVMTVIQGEKQYQIIKITLDSGESIEATAEHPFYIKGKGWNPASSLKVGQALQLHNGTTVVITEIDTSVRLEKVYNLTVANTHNYFVGGDGVLVHNCKVKPVNLPSWRNMGIDIDHIASGHMKGGSRVSSIKDLFPDGMSKSQVEKAVRQAYRYGERVKTQGDRVLVRGNNIEMWVNTKTKTIETAYPFK
jgi:hypothetical protein